MLMAPRSSAEFASHFSEIRLDCYERDANLQEARK
jgi:hypothetical protein